MKTAKINTEPLQRAHYTYMRLARERIPWLKGKESEIKAKFSNLCLKVIEIEIMRVFTSKSMGACIYAILLVKQRVGVKFWIPRLILYGSTVELC